MVFAAEKTSFYCVHPKPKAAFARRGGFANRARRLAARAFTEKISNFATR